MSCNPVRTGAGLVAGAVFGAGLALSGMTDPSVVLGFLDLAGAWDPALLFVMIAAVPVTFLGYRLALAQARPLFADRFALPTARAIDARLIGGSALFGLGWGLAGWCPGPAIASLTAPGPALLGFVAAMLAGLWAARLMPVTTKATPPLPPGV